MKTKHSAEEINNLLFDDEPTALHGKDDNLTEKQPKAEHRLLKERGLSTELDSLEPVPYYKRPIVQTAVLLAVALPMSWGLISAFTTGGVESQRTTTVVEDREKQFLKQSLNVERKKNTQLEIQNGLRKQKIDVVPARPKSTPQPARLSQPSAQPAPPSQPSPQLARASEPLPRPTVVRYSPPPQHFEFRQAPIRPALFSEPASRSNSPVFRPTPIASAPHLPKDPMQQWLAATNAGRSGGMSVNSESPSRRSTLVAMNTSASLPSGGIGLPPGQNTYLSDSSDPTTHLLVGTRASGQLETAIAWSGNNSRSSTQYFRVKLTQPLKAADGKEAIPAGSYLVTQVNSNDNVGLLQLSAVAVQIGGGNGQIIEKALPPGAVRILGKGGKPLKAAYHGPRTGGGGIGNLFLSGLGTAANRYGGGYAYSALQQMQNRQNFQPQSVYFTLPEGTSVEAYVNQSFSL